MSTFPAIALETSSFATNLGEVEMSSGGEGGRAAVVYLHSASGEGAAMPFLEQLASKRRVFAPRFPGFGSSEGLEHVEDIEDAAFHLLDLLDRLELESADLVGMSLGGWMAAELAVRWPERVRRMALVNAVGLYVEGSPITEIFGRRLDELSAELYADPEFPPAALMRSMSGLVERDPASVPFDLLRPAIQAQAVTAKLGWNPYLHDPKLRARLGRISAPTLVVHAVRDGIVGRPHAEAYVGGIPDGRLLEVDGSAHLALIEKPEELSSAISEFLDGD